MSKTSKRAMVTVFLALWTLLILLAWDHVLERRQELPKALAECNRMTDKLLNVCNDAPKDEAVMCFSTTIIDHRRCYSHAEATY